MMLNRSIILFSFLLFQFCIISNTIQFEVPKKDEIKIKEAPGINYYFKELNFPDIKNAISTRITRIVEKKMQESFSTLGGEESTSRIEIFINHKIDPFAEAWIGLAQWAFSPTVILNIFPFWTDILYTLKYNVVIDGVQIKSYTYEVNQEFYIGMWFIPFSWINFFSNKYEDTFGATVDRLVFDMKKDGLIK